MNALETRRESPPCPRNPSSRASGSREAYIRPSTNPCRTAGACATGNRELSWSVGHAVTKITSELSRTPLYVSYPLHDCRGSVRGMEPRQLWRGWEWTLVRALRYAARIRFQRNRLRVRLAVDCEAHRVGAGSQPSGSATPPPPRPRPATGAGIAPAQASFTGAATAPRPAAPSTRRRAAERNAMHSGSGRRRLGWSVPDRLNVQCFSVDRRTGVSLATQAFTDPDPSTSSIFSGWVAVVLSQ